MQTFFIVVASLLSRVLSLSVKWQRVGVQAVVAVSLLLGGGLAQAQTALVGEPYRKTNQLITAKNYAAALQTADAHLTGNPRDPQMRLIRSRVLIAQGKTDEARNQLLAITQEFPEIAEPWKAPCASIPNTCSRCTTWAMFTGRLRKTITARPLRYNPATVSCRKKSVRCNRLPPDTQNSKEPAFASQNQGDRVWSPPEQTNSVNSPSAPVTF